MKKIKYLAIILTVLFMVVSLTACGGGSAAPAAPANTAVKDDFKDYLNNYAIPAFQVVNNEIVTIYTEAVQTGDGNVMAEALSEDLPILNTALLEEMIEYSPKTAEVQEVHNIFIAAVELRGEAYAQILEVLLDLDAEKDAISAAFDMLDDADAIFAEYVSQVETMKKDLGLV